MTVRDSSRVDSLAGSGASGDGVSDSSVPSPGASGDGVSAGPPRQSGPAGALAFGRNVWRQLTSMRTALILLFLLALASLPGALLPQWSLNSAKTAQYILDYPTLGPLLDKFGFFEVFGSPWPSIIKYLSGGTTTSAASLADAR